MLRPSPTLIIGATVTRPSEAESVNENPVSEALRRCREDGDELLECVPFASSPSESESSNVVDFFVRRRGSLTRGDEGGAGRSTDLGEVAVMVERGPAKESSRGAS